MEPVLLVCGGCGGRIRTTRPEKARGRDCPRCRSPLASAVDRALGLDLPRANPAAMKARGLPTAALAILVTVGAFASMAVRDDPPTASGSPLTAGNPLPVVEHGPMTRTGPLEARASTAPVAEPDEPGHAEIPDLSPPPPPGPRDLAILDGSRRDPVLAPPTPRSGLVPPDPDAPPPPPALPAERPIAQDPKPAEPRRLLVRDSRGLAIVAREYGTLRGRLAAILPDGQIGWPESVVATQEPFVPMGVEDLKREILEDPEFATYRVIHSDHYVIVYQSSEPFARASAELLEKLNDGLTGTLKKNGLPVKAAEFPLVAVIFATEADFRANRRVARDVQAYYEILSNRIYFYEKSSRDQDTPEVSALRKPQTVAHEGTHQILQNVGIQPRLADWPLWLVEGLAEYCSATRFTKKGADWLGIGQANPIHLATIRDLDDPLPNQFRADHREALATRARGTPLVEYLVTRKDLTPTDYAFSWALTHYLATQRLDDFVAYIKRMSLIRPDQEQSPEDQLAAFREVFGADLAQMDAKVGKYLKKFKPTDALPHYAVIFEQPVGPAAVRRHYMVSQSPSVIRQWIDSVTAPEGGEPHWRVFPHMTQKKALEAAEQWINQGR